MLNLYYFKLILEITKAVTILALSVFMRNIFACFDFWELPSMGEGRESSEMLQLKGLLMNV
jgi:hypothetical protein